jgi:CheY-like chemotaxis protein
MEPHDDTRELYAEYLRVTGYRVVEARTTADALARAQRADILVTGISLGGDAEGLAAVRRLRDAARRRTHIIVLTSYAFSATRDEAIAAGADVFLVKPCLPETLVQHVRRLLAFEAPRKPAKAKHRRGAEPRRRSS